MNWAPLTMLFNLFIPPLNVAVDQGIAVLAAWVLPFLSAGLMLYGFIRMVVAALKGGTDGFNTFAECIIGSVIAVAVSQAAWYGDNVREFVQVELIQGIGSALAGINGGQTLSAAMFDAAFVRGVVAGAKFLGNLPWSIQGLALVGVWLIFMIFLVIAVAYPFGIWLYGIGFSGVALAVGPLFIGLFAIGPAKRLFWGWLNVLLSNVLLTVLCVLVMVMSIAAQTEVLSMILNSARLARTTFGTAAAANEFAQGGMLVVSIAVNCFFIWVSYNLPGMASSITHGFAGYGHMSPSMLGIGWLGGSGGGGRGAESPPAAPPTPPAMVPQVTPPGPAIGSGMEMRPMPGLLATP